MTKAATKTVAVAAATAKAKADPDAIWVRTKSGVERRYRAGLAFSAEPIMLDVNELSQEQLDAIEADPLLVGVDAPEADVAVDAKPEAASTAKDAE